MNYSRIIDVLNMEKTTSFSLVDSREGYVAEYHDTSSGISICFDKYFPLRCPDFFVEPNSEIRVHISRSGKMCLFDESSELVDFNKPERVVSECYDRAINILNLNSDRDKIYDELIREADSYWSQLSNGRLIVSTADYSKTNYSKYPIISYYCDDERVPFRFYLGETNEKIKDLEKKLNVSNSEKGIVTDCTVIRLKRGTKFISIKEKYGWNELRQYINKNVDKKTKKMFRLSTDKKRKKVYEVIVLVLPTRYGDIAFGFVVMGGSLRWTPMSKILGIKCYPLYVRRMDYNYLTNRSGAYRELGRKKVLLLGCGSVGGFIATNLCKMGIRNLDILDKDSLSEENIYRHFFGIKSVTTSKNNNKADLMKKHLEEDYLEIKVDSFVYGNQTVEEFLDEPSRIKGYDLVISALGEPTLDLKISDVLNERNLKIPFICAFNEPYGIGGHVILTNNSQDSCLRCAYTDKIGGNLVPFRASLVEPNQSFKKNISGCSSAFTPYSVLDSVQTALLATRVSISLLKGNEERNVVYTWFGDDKLLLEEGFKTSDYYKKNKNKIRKRKKIEKNEKCNICSFQDKGKNEK